MSDGVAAGTREDRSGAALAQLLAKEGFEVVERAVCPDGVDDVSATLRNLAEGFAGLVVTTGGTGFSPRDLTPEGTQQVIERAAPGLAEAMRAVSPLGRLSRGVAGTTGSCLVAQHPGFTGRGGRMPPGAARCAPRTRSACWPGSPTPTPDGG